jgi:hypothetical protein
MAGQEQVVQSEGFMACCIDPMLQFASVWECQFALQVGRFLGWLEEWGRTSPDNGWIHTPSCVGWSRRFLDSLNGGHSPAVQAES